MGKGKAAPKRKYVTRRRLEEALSRDIAEHPNRSAYNRPTGGKRKGNVVHPRMTRLVTVEMRTGSGTCVRVIGRSGAFRHSSGSAHAAGNLFARIRRGMDAFYGRIDRDLREMRYKEDLALRVPYAVRIRRAERRRLDILRRDAIRRGLV